MFLTTRKDTLELEVRGDSLWVGAGDPNDTLRVCMLCMDGTWSEPDEAWHFSIVDPEALELVMAMLSRLWGRRRAWRALARALQRSKGAGRATGTAA